MRWLAALLLLGCGAAPRFEDRPIVWRADDTRDIPEPAEHEPLLRVYRLKVNFTRVVPHGLSLPRTTPARDVNALDEVPDSSWFENRIGVRAMSPEEAARGRPNEGPPRPPLTVAGAKRGGATPGFLLEDATKRRFLVKFDDRGVPERDTGAGVVVNRIFHALGYHVANDQVVFFRREDLALARDVTPSDVDAVLVRTVPLPDGRYRGIASELLPGKPKGPAPAWGVRADDPNDTIPHPHRRSLRALRVFGAWVNHTDMKEDSVLDMYVEEDGRRFLRHHLIDFTRIGTWGGWNGYEGRVDWPVVFRGWFSFGLWRRAWEDRAPAPYPALGWFTPAPFDPDDWNANEPYPAFWECDDADRYWAAKLVARFDRPVLEAIVAEGRYSDPAAARYFVDALLARRDAITRAYLERVSPLDDFAFEAEGLCARDLGVVYGTGAAGAVERLDEDGEVVGRHAVASDGRVCLPVSSDDYAVARLRVVRGEAARPPMQVHYRGGAAPRLLGVLRVAP